MISFTIENIDLVQIDFSLGEVPRLWKKARGRKLWGSDLDLSFRWSRFVQGRHMLIREWRIRDVYGRKVAAVFWVDTNRSTCEVFLTSTIYTEEVFLRSILMALTNEEDPKRIDTSIYLNQK